MDEVELRGIHRGARSLYDSHVHTTASDGELSPAEVAYEACMRGSTVVVTDHYSVSGVGEAVAEAERICGGWSGNIVGGVEFSVRVELLEYRQLRKLHVLGVGVDHRSRRLVDWLFEYRRLRGADIDYAMKVKCDLEGRGFRFHGRLMEKLSSRRNVYQVLAESMFSCPENRRLIERHFDLRIWHPASRRKRRAKNAQARRRMVAGLREDYGDFKAAKPGLDEVVELVKAAGGYSVVAHPVVSVPQLPYFSPRRMVDAFSALGSLGVDGIEAYTPTHRLEVADMIARAASDAGLMAFGGSDTHRARHSLGRLTSLPSGEFMRPVPV